jgi:hypothetical protein
MTARKDLSRPAASPRNRSERVKDEVYRQMFRLEAHRPGAEMDLSIALLRAWITSVPASASSKQRQWLEKICPICLAMIEAAQQAADSGR